MRSIWPVNNYADHLHMDAFYTVDFFQQTGIPIAKKEQQQYLIHAQNVIVMHANLGRNMLWMQEQITLKSKKALATLRPGPAGGLPE